jgi:hypothetical protein
VLQSGNAEDLAALLRPAAGNRLPILEIAASNLTAADGNTRATLTLKVTNISREDLGGELKVIVPPKGEQKTPTMLGENPLPAIAAGKTIELTLPLSGEVPAAKGEANRAVIVECTTRRDIQRTAVILPAAVAPVVKTPPRFEPAGTQPE